MDGHAGARLLYAARLVGPDGKRTSLRLAVAVSPPSRLRLEALGPAGGTRLVLATDGAQAVALVVPERRFDTAPANADALAAWIGLPLGPAALVSLLAGRAPCGAAGAVGDGAGVDPCPNLRFEPSGSPPAGAEECSGSLYTSPGRDLLATIDCDGDGGWPERIRVGFQDSARSIELRRTEGPAAGLLGDSLFAPAIPAGFRRADLLGTTDATPLLGSGSGEAP